MRAPRKRNTKRRQRCDYVFGRPGLGRGTGASGLQQVACARIRNWLGSAGRGGRGAGIKETRGKPTNEKGGVDEGGCTAMHPP